MDQVHETAESSSPESTSVAPAPADVAPSATDLAVGGDAFEPRHADESRSVKNIVNSVLRGAMAGAVGVAAMTAAEKIEQRFTHRPNSYVPAHTLERLIRLPDRSNEDRRVVNHVMHWGTGMALGSVRGVMAARGARGLWASLLHSVIRLTTDQTLENATGVGSPPWKWPRQELVIDLSHKLIYALTTGVVVDRLVVEDQPARMRGGETQGAGMSSSKAVTG